jgi:hypothetical protein
MKKRHDIFNENECLAQKNKFYVLFTTFENTEVAGSNMFHFQ